MNTTVATTNDTSASIACVIPYYNGSAFVERAIQSVRDQTRAADELIIVNDGSKPSEAAFLHSLRDKYDFHIIDKQNGGQGSARNAGVKASSSDYICFLDQDDLYLPRHNEILLSAVPRVFDRRFGWVYADVVEAEGDGSIVRIGMVKEHSTHPKKSLLDLLRNDMFVLPSASLISRRAYEDVGGFDEQFTGYEDDDLFLRLFRRGWTNTFVDEPVTVWCIHGESTSYSVKMSRSRFRYLKKLLRDFPDDPLRVRYYFRDLFVPRFGGLIVGDATQAVKSGHKDADELLAILREYWQLVTGSPGMNPESIAYLNAVVENLTALRQSTLTAADSSTHNEEPPQLSAAEVPPVVVAAAGDGPVSSAHNGEPLQLNAADAPSIVVAAADDGADSSTHGEPPRLNAAVPSVAVAGAGRESIFKYLCPTGFNAKWYRQKYPDVDGSGMDPYEHYYWIGRHESRLLSDGGV